MLHRVHSRNFRFCYCCITNTVLFITRKGVHINSIVGYVGTSYAYRILMTSLILLRYTSHVIQVCTVCVSTTLNIIGVSIRCSYVYLRTRNPSIVVFFLDVYITCNTHSWKGVMLSREAILNVVHDATLLSQQFVSTPSTTHNIYKYCYTRERIIFTG